jgi:septum formation protein
MLLKNLDPYRIILASASPRRKELLAGLGIPFEVMVRPVNEDAPQGMIAEAAALLLSERKALAFDDILMDERVLLITADTVVCLDNRLLGKPSAPAAAVAMLMELSGKKHRVITGVTLRSIQRNVSFTAATDVFFKKLHMDEIRHYVDHYKPFDKAGAYGIQEWIGYTGVERIEGSFYNVMGLPLQKLYEELRKF